MGVGGVFPPFPTGLNFQAHLRAMQDCREEEDEMLTLDLSSFQTSLDQSRSDASFFLQLMRKGGAWAIVTA